MDHRPLQLALRETQATFTSPRALVSMAAAVLVLGLSGPFNTFTAFDTPTRLVYWLAIVVLTYAVGQAIAQFTLALLAERVAALPARIAIATLVCSLPVTVVVIAVNAVAYGGRTSIEPLRLWAYCTAIVLAVVTVMSMAGRGATAADPPAIAKPATSPAPSPTAAPIPPAILERVPHPQRGRLLALSVKDHYVEVITEKGRALVLMRLSDAMRETGSIAGLQIHRSHWVALDAVRRVIKTGGKVAIELPGGKRLPVSRGYLPAARQAGLVL